MTQNEKMNAKLLVIKIARQAFDALAAGQGEVICLHDDGCAVTFRFALNGPPFFFCIFDDAGELDYIAWLSRDQEAVSFHDMNPESAPCLDPLDRMSNEARDALQDRLWEARDRARKEEAV